MKLGRGDARGEKRIEAKLAEMAEVLRGNGWHMPDTSGPGQVGGFFGEADYRSAGRQLFGTRVIFEITKGKRWSQAYEDALNTPTQRGRPTPAILCLAPEGGCGHASGQRAV